MEIRQLFAGLPIPRKLSNGSAAEFVERRLSHQLEELAAHWHGCPECGAKELHAPRLEVLERQPRAAGVCVGCGAVFGYEPGGAPLLLAPGRQSSGLPT